jgi:hypothetical protein
MHLSQFCTAPLYKVAAAFRRELRRRVSYDYTVIVRSEEQRLPIVMKQRSEMYSPFAELVESHTVVIRPSVHCGSGRLVRLRIPQDRDQPERCPKWITILRKRITMKK